MKALIILIILALVVSVVVWRSRKAQAEAEVARRAAVKRQKKQLEKNVKQEDMVWPVMIRPVSGKQAAEADLATEELSMTAIAFEPLEQSAAVQSGAKKLAS